MEKNLLRDVIEDDKLPVDHNPKVVLQVGINQGRGALAAAAAAAEAAGIACAAFTLCVSDGKTQHMVVVGGPSLMLD